MGDVSRQKELEACTGGHDMGDVSRQKELEALWRHNRAKRKKVLTRSELLKLSPQQLQSVPAQLRRPDKLHGSERPKGLRGSTVFQYLLQLALVWRDKRFDDCISALLEHRIIEIRRHTNKQGKEVVTYEFSNRQGLYADRYNENQQAECLGRSLCTDKARQIRTTGMCGSCRRVGPPGQ